MVKFLKALFKVRDCKRMDGPCLNYQIDLCNAPCDKKITEENYKKLVDNVSMFFEGKFDEIMAALKKEMDEAAKNHEYEKAAVLRDQIGLLMVYSKNRRWNLQGVLTKM